MTGQFLAIDATRLPREERTSDAIGKAVFRKELFSDPDTGMLVRLVRDRHASAPSTGARAMPRRRHGR
jgi:hypothetical protein